MAATSLWGSLRRGAVDSRAARESGAARSRPWSRAPEPLSGYWRPSNPACRLMAAGIGLERWIARPGGAASVRETPSFRATRTASRPERSAPMREGNTISPPSPTGGYAAAGSAPAACVSRRQASVQ